MLFAVIEYMHCLYKYGLYYIIRLILYKRQPDPFEHCLVIKSILHSSHIGSPYVQSLYMIFFFSFWEKGYFLHKFLFVENYHNLDLKTILMSTKSRKKHIVNPTRIIHPLLTYNGSALTWLLKSWYIPNGTFNVSFDGIVLISFSVTSNNENECTSFIIIHAWFT